MSKRISRFHHEIYISCFKCLKKIAYSSIRDHIELFHNDLSDHDKYMIFYNARMEIRRGSHRFTDA